MTDIIWKEPQPVTGKAASAAFWARVAAELKSRPGEWACVRTHSSNSWAGHIRKGSLTAFRPAGSFESTHRGVVQDGARRIETYARYVGDPS